MPMTIGTLVIRHFIHLLHVVDIICFIQIAMYIRSTKKTCTSCILSISVIKRTYR